MFTLFKSEWIRIRKAAYLAAAAHLIILLFMVNFGLIFSHSIGFKISLVLCYGFLGLLFAILQIRLYKEPGQWIYLLNRPLSEKQAFMALFLAASICFLVVIVLPYGIITAALEWFSQQVIDYRHYLQLIYLLGVCISFYLVGCFISLTNNKWFISVLILPILTLMSLNLGGQVWFLQSLIIVLLISLVLLFFKINLNQPLKGRSLFLVFTLVLQWCGFLAINAVISVIELTQAELTYLSHQDQEHTSSQFPEDFNQVSYLPYNEIILAGLTPLSAAEFTRYERQMSLSEAHRIRKRVWFHPTEQQIQLMDERAMVLTDQEQQYTWTFSHDEMLFVGLNHNTLKSAGYLGPDKSSLNSNEFNSSDRFNGVPWIAGNQMIVDHVLYLYDPILNQIVQVFTAKPGEKILNVLQQQGAINSVITNKSLYLFDDIITQKKEYPLSAFLSMKLPDDYNNLWGIYVIEIKNKFLLSLLYGKDHRKDVYQAHHMTYEFDLTGQINHLVNKPLKHSNGFAMRYLDYIISPAWTVINDQFPPLPNRDRYLEQRRWPNTIPTVILWTMIGLSCCYFLITFYWSKRKSLPMGKSLLWSLTNAMTGLPGLMSYLLVERYQNPSSTKNEVYQQHNTTHSMEQNHV